MINLSLIEYKQIKEFEDIIIGIHSVKPELLEDETIRGMVVTVIKSLDTLDKQLASKVHQYT